MTDMSWADRERIGKVVKSGEIFDEGTILPQMDKMALAKAIEGELDRVKCLPNRRITIHMNEVDAIEFARLLRKLVILGY